MYRFNPERCHKEQRRPFKLVFNLLLSHNNFQLNPQWNKRPALTNVSDLPLMMESEGCHEVANKIQTQENVSVTKWRAPHLSPPLCVQPIRLQLKMIAALIWLSSSAPCPTPPPSLPWSFCCRALQRRRLGDDVCDAADRVGRGRVCVWVLQPSGLQSLSGRRERWGNGTQQHKQQLAELVWLLWLSPNESTFPKNEKKKKSLNRTNYFIIYS